MKIKIRFATIFMLLFTINGIAQDYHCVIPNQQQFFQLDSPYYYPQVNLFVMPDENNSPIKAIYFDSSLVVTNGVMHFGFHTWRDTSLASFPCVDLNGQSWIGSKMLELNNNKAIFFNEHNDTIKIETLAAVNDSWHFYYNYTDNSYINATVDSIVWLQIAGIQDSVKCISLTAHDSTGAVDTNSIVNGQQIYLSKSNGLLKTIGFTGFPSGITALHRITDLALPTVAEIYDFNVDDEFEYYSYSYQSSSADGYKYLKVLSKSFNANVDTVIYQFHRIETAFTSWSGDTIVESFPYSTNSFFGTLPEQIRYSIPDSTNLVNYVINIDSNYNYRPLYNIVGGYFLYHLPGDSCYNLNNFEPVPTTDEYIPGLGRVEQSSNSIYQTGGFSETKLIWYHKGNEYWGNPVTIGINQYEIPNYSISIYPNPNTGNFTLKLPQNTELSTIEILNVLGESVFKDELPAGQSKKEIYLSNLKSGIYICKVVSNLNTSQLKFTVSN